VHPTTSDPLQFTDISVDIDGTIISWSWSFGDGTTSTIRNPSHQYADDGVYLVSFTVTDNDGAENTTTTQSITVSNIPPLANFIYSPVHPTTSDPLQFNDTSIDIDGMITLWSWSFGDGTTSPLQNASHQYTKQGTYNITLNVTDDDGAHATKSTSIFVANTPPTANFMYTPLNPTTSDIIQFTDTSTDPDGTIIAWSWTFGDGNTSTQRHPTHTYQKKGIYIITLEIRDDNEATNIVSKSIAVANTPPKVYFTYSPSNPKTIDTIQFNDTSIDSDGLIISWIWTFGDGGTSTERNPSHTYESAGFYTVTLTVTDNDGGENITNTLLQVANTPPTSNFSYTPTYPTIYDLVYFSDTSIDPDGTLQSWYWDFGDGIHSNTRNPTHQFTQNRTFTVTLEVTDNNGSTDSFTKEIITRKIYKKTTYAGNETTLDFLNETQTILSITTTTPTNVTMSKYSQNPTGKNIYNNISNLENYIDITVEKESVIQWPVFIKMYYTQENLANSHVTKNQLIGIYFWDNSTMEWNSYDNTGVNTSDNQNGYEGYCWAQVWHLTTLVQAGDTEPPMKVEGLTVSNAHNGRLNLIWGTGTDNVQIHHYKIYRNSIFLINRTSTSYQDIGLVNGQSYTYRVSAVDTSGNEGEPSNPKSSTPTESSSGGGGSSGGAGGTPPPGPQNKNPIANASAGAPYQGFINAAILFNGSSSYDPDGNITKWLWVFGDNSNGTGKTVQHSYLKTGTFNVTLTVFDDEGASNTDTITCEITQPNRPPSKPLITGPINGKKNTMYNYTALSSDADNDTLQYTFDWGDSLSQTSTFLPNGSGFIANHSWMYAGRYDVTVTVTDNQTASSSKVSIYIDATQIGEIGYLIDYDGDEIYDAFYSDKLTQTVTIEEKNGNYNIDTDGDGDWDYTYDTTGKLSAYQQPQTPGFELIFVLCACVLTVLLWRKKQIV